MKEEISFFMLAASSASAIFAGLFHEKYQVKFLIAASLFLLAFAAMAAPTRWVAAPNPDASFPGTQIVTGYGGAIGGIPGFLFNPGNKNLWITTVCASGGTVNLAGMAIVANGCREAFPGLLVPKNEPVLCAAVDCAFTGILK